MYEVTLLDDFEASHYLTDGSTGEESRPHGHRYSVEFTMRGGALDEHGYLVNIVTIRKELDETIAFFRGQLLNSLHVFTGKNPSIERFAACASYDNK